MDRNINNNPAQKSALVRGLNEENYEILEKLISSSEPNWFKDVISDNSLFFALRNNIIDIYTGGSVLFQVKFSNGEAIPKTHIKFLIDSQKYIELKGGVFQFSSKDYIQDLYQGAKTIDKIKKIAGKYAGKERAGVHRIISGDKQVVDIEVSFTRTENNDEISESSSRNQDRIDIVRLQKNENGYSLIFWEAKCYDNKDIFDKKIVSQVKRYEKQIDKNHPDLINYFRQVCKFQSWVQQKRLNLADDFYNVLNKIGRGDIALNINPKVRILVFGYGDAQRQSKKWRMAKTNIEVALDGAQVNNSQSRIFSIGNPVKGYLATRFGKP